MNRRARRARCFIQVLLPRFLKTCFYFSDTHYPLYLQLPGFYRSNYNEWSQRDFVEYLVFTLLDDLAQKV